MKRPQQAVDPRLARLAAIQEDAKLWKTRYYAEHEKIVSFALKHSPKLRASNEDGLPGFNKSISLGGTTQPEFVCNAPDCHSFWPCPSYLWATGTSDFKLTASPVEDPDGTQ